MIRLLVVDDHAVVRSGIRQVVQESADIEVTAEAGSGVEALELAEKSGFDVILLDISLPGRGGRLPEEGERAGGTPRRDPQSSLGWEVRQ